MTEEELDKLHDCTMENLYEVFKEEFDAYFEFYEASLKVLGYGKGTFPFSTSYDCVMDRIDDSLTRIEGIIIDHIREQLKIIFEERRKKSPLQKEISDQSKEQKAKLAKKIRDSIKELKI